MNAKKILWQQNVSMDRSVSPQEWTRARWASIAELADDDGIIAASQQVIAKTMGLSWYTRHGMSHLVSVLDRLVVAGYLLRVSRGHGGPGGTNVYELTTPNESPLTALPADRDELLRLARRVGAALVETQTVAA